MLKKETEVELTEQQQGTGRNRKSVSVIIPHFNASSTLPRALKSLFSQTCPPDEIIVVDDASDPTERRIVRQLTQGYVGVQLIEMPRNQGPASARNRGWDEATGEWVAFLDSDDAWHPRKLEIQMKVAFSSNKTPTLIACRTTYVKDLTQLLFSSIPFQIPTRLLRIQDLLLRNQMSTPSVVIRKNIEQRFREGRRYSEDFELWLTLVGSGHRALVVEVPLAAIFKAPYGESGLSSHALRMIGGEYNAYIGAARAGALSLPQLVFGLAVSTSKSAIRLVKILFRRHKGRL